MTWHFEAAGDELSPLRSAREDVIEARTGNIQITWLSVTVVLVDPDVSINAKVHHSIIARTMMLFRGVYGEHKALQELLYHEGCW